MSRQRENAITQRSTLILEDGGHLSYYYIGNGPGLIVVHGALSSALTQLDLAIALSHRYTVYLPSRRGRGLSGPYPEAVTKKFKPFGPQATSDPKSPLGCDPEFCAAVLDTEISDLVALIKHTKSSFALGVSAGAAILLEACVLCSASHHQEFGLIKKVIIFEPPILFNDSTALGPDGVYRAVSAKLGSWLMQASPCFIVRFLTEMTVKLEKREIRKRRQKVVQDAGVEPEDEGVITMEGLAPLLRYDFAAISAMTGPLGKYSKANVDRDILLLAASDSPGYLKQSVQALNEIRVEFRRLKYHELGTGFSQARSGEVV